MQSQDFLSSLGPFKDMFKERASRRIAQTDKSKGVQVFLKQPTLDKLDFLGYVGGMNRSQVLNYLLDNPEIFANMTHIMLQYSEACSIDDAQRFQTIKKTTGRRSKLQDKVISVKQEKQNFLNEIEPFLCYLEDKETFFSEYSEIRAWQDYSLCKDNVQRLKKEKERLNYLIKVLNSDKGQQLLTLTNCSNIVQFISLMESKYKNIRASMLKSDFKLTDAEINKASSLLD